MNNVKEQVHIPMKYHNISCRSTVADTVYVGTEAPIAVRLEHIWTPLQESLILTLELPAWAWNMPGHPPTKP